MSPPTIGSEIEVRRSGKITRYNNDNTLNVKLKSGRGRPHKVPFGDVIHPVTVASVPANDICPVSPLPALEPIPALPPMNSTPPERRRSRTGLIIGSVLTIGGMIIAGVFHEIGQNLWKVAMAYVQGGGPLMH